MRKLAYILKYWAKRRQMNNPMEGTLSSYGFILCLIHFLQNLANPILPNLQHLPRDWCGEAIGEMTEIPINWEVNAVDGSKCNTYFYEPDSHSFNILRVSVMWNSNMKMRLIYISIGYGFQKQGFCWCASIQILSIFCFFI